MRFKALRKQQFQRGIGIIEMLVAVAIGLVILAAGIGFLINTSRSIKLGQEQTQNTSKAQQVLSVLTREIKSAHVEAPPLFLVSPAWNTLPPLPHFSHVELSPYPHPAGTLIMPATPAARRFLGQSSLTGAQNTWFPNPSINESNSLVFYKAPAPGPGGTSIIERITYRLSNGRLLREAQRLSSTPTSYTVPAPSVTELADQVQQIQFTYPIFEQQMTPALDTQLTAMVEPDRTRFINENYRKVIGIKIILGGGNIKGQQLQGIELKTEVRLRSE